jgi:cysteinyl-tRNA synthetase
MLVDGLMHTILALRERARIKKDWPASDTIRTDLEKLHIVVKDTKDGPTWNIE